MGAAMLPNLLSGHLVLLCGLDHLSPCSHHPKATFKFLKITGSGGQAHANSEERFIENVTVYRTNVGRTYI
jgi:hypothetical protein